MPTTMPLARRDSLVIEHVNNELLIYEPHTHNTMCLNEFATLVWERCDGTTTAQEIAARIKRETKVSANVAQVWYALDLLEKKQLLQEHVDRPTEFAHLTRRDLLRSAGGVGAAIAIPVIISLVAPTPVMAATCIENHGGCTPNGSNCTTNEQCCSCRCNLGSGNPKCVS